MAVTACHAGRTTLNSACNVTTRLRRRWPLWRTPHYLLPWRLASDLQRRNLMATPATYSRAGVWRQLAPATIYNCTNTGADGGRNSSINALPRLGKRSFIRCSGEHHALLPHAAAGPPACLRLGHAWRKIQSDLTWAEAGIRASSTSAASGFYLLCATAWRTLPAQAPLRSCLLVLPAWRL